jgi:hypothetical protein
MAYTPQIAANRGKPPATIWIASGFIILCVIALIVFDVALVLASLNVANNPVYATRTQTKGFVFLAGFILFGAWLLARGVIALLKKGQPSTLFIILGIPLILGSIGEVADLLGTASGASNLIGGGILLLFAIPMILLRLPSSKKWYTN